MGKHLNRARLVAIDKPNGGVRPVAIGEIFSKLAGIILLQRYEKSLEPLFAPMQQGVFSQAGCERIVHKLRDRWLDGHSILTVDMQNAFNSPSREEIAKCVFAFATLKPFQRFFAAEYSNASELLFYGSDGSLTDIIMSSAGVRQGSALASLYFCVFCQPILETLASEFPGIEINAYIDDITLVTSSSSSSSRQVGHKTSKIHFFLLRHLTMREPKLLFQVYINQSIKTFSCVGLRIDRT